MNEYVNVRIKYERIIFRYPSEQECQGAEECSAVWFATPWSECTAECGGGTYSRKVIL